MRSVSVWTPRGRFRAVATAGLVSAAIVVGCGGSDSADEGASASAPPSDCKPRHPGIKTITPGTLTVVGLTAMPLNDIVDGKPTGVDGDIINAIAEMECLKVSATNTPASAVIPAITSKRADVGSGNWYRSHARVEVVDITAPTYVDRIGVVSKEGYDSIEEMEAAGVTLGEVQGTLWAEPLKEKLGDNFRLYQEVSQPIDDVKNGRLDAALTNYANGLRMEREGQLEGLKIEPLAPAPGVEGLERPAQSGLPYTKGNTSLGKAMDEDIAELKRTGEFEEILKKHGLDPALGDTGDPYLV